MPNYRTKYNALKILDQCGILYKKDFNLLLTKDNVAANINALLNNEYIEIKSIPKQGRKRTNKNESEDIVRITKKGRYFYLENESKDYFNNMQNNNDYVKLQKSVNHIFKTTNTSEMKKAWPILTHQKTIMLFYQAGVEAFPFQKPSLPYLWYNP